MNLKQITNILDNHKSYRGTQINLLLFDLCIKRLLASKRNQIYSDAFQHAFQLLIYYTSRLPMKLLTDLHQITDISGPPDFSRYTIQLTLFDLYIRTLYTSKRNQIYYKSFFNKHFRSPSNIHLRYTNPNPHGSQLNHRHL